MAKSSRSRFLSLVKISGRVLLTPQRTITHDPNRALLYQDVDDFRNQSFHNFGLTVSILSTASASQVWTQDGQSIGFDEYSFLVFGLEAKPMRVRITKPGRAEVWYGDVWCNIARYLEQLVTPVNDVQFLGQSEHELKLKRLVQQQRWWTMNGKYFALTKLPAEIREMIYAHCIGCQIEPYPACKARRLGPNYRAIAALRLGNPNVNLLLASKLVYGEASRVLSKYATFRINILGVLDKLLQNSRQSSRIRSLELSLSHRDFFKLFGLETSEIRFETRAAAHVLRNLKLDQLKLVFAAPSRTLGIEWLDDACQKLVVNRILDAAWPFLRGHPVRLCGYVEKSSIARFEAWRLEEHQRIGLWQKQRTAARLEKGELADYYAWLDEDEGGVTLLMDDTSGEMAKEESWTSTDAPFICRCKKSCSDREWRLRD